MELKNRGCGGGGGSIRTGDVISNRESIQHFSSWGKGAFIGIGKKHLKSRGVYLRKGR